MSFEPRSGDTFGPYRIEREIGRGGMGVVYQAHDTRLGRRVALKLVAPDLATDEGFAARFEREARIAATLEHPHIVPVYEAGRIDGSLVIAMRFIDGDDLGAVLAGGTLRPARVARLVAQVAGGLDAAHREGMVHRDVKPANVLLSGRGDDEHAYLSDFGLTRDATSQSALTNTGQWIGTIDYAAPEQIQGQAIDARSDVYALGCVVFHALVGHAPFTGTPAAKLYGHLSAAVPSVRSGRADVNAEVDPAVRRAMSKAPADRFPSAGDFARALGAAVTGVPNAKPEHSVATGRALTGIPTFTEVTTLVQPPDPVSAPTRVLRQPRRRRPAVLAVAAIAVFAAGAAAAALAAVQLGSEDPLDRAARTEPAAGTPTPTATATPRPNRAKRRSERPSPTATPTPTQVPVETPPPSSSLSYAPYTPPSGTFAVDLPASSGWTVQGERELNPGLLRTTVSGPGGATIWIDVTPAEPPGFSVESVDIVSDARLAGGIREIVFTRGGPDFCATDRCVDYQIDLGSSGIAVLGGPGSRARAVARKVATTIDPHL